MCRVIRAHGVVPAQNVVGESLSLAHCQPFFLPDCSIFGRSVVGRRISRPLHANLRAIQSDGLTRLHRRPLCAQRSFDAVSGMAVPSAAIEELTRVISLSGRCGVFKVVLETSNVSHCCWHKHSESFSIYITVPKYSLLVQFSNSIEP